MLSNIAWCVCIHRSRNTLYLFLVGLSTTSPLNVFWGTLSNCRQAAKHIVADQYVENGKDLEVERPSRCPRETCNRRDCFWRHTGYYRQVKEEDESVSVRIQRFMCRYCGLVISCLFSFLVPYRQGSARV